MKHPGHSRVLLVLGAPGTGKSTLAQAIAARAGVALIAKDVIKEPLLDVLGAADRAASRALSDASFAVQFALTRHLLAAASACVLEGNFRPEHARELIHLFGAQAHPVPRIVQVACCVAESERRARLAARALDPARHPGHRDVWAAQDPAPPDALQWLELPGERLCVQTGTAASSAGERHLLRLARWLRADPDALAPGM